MAIKILHWLGVIACIGLIISCFLSWTYYADIHETFTGFFSYRNEYGKPGKLLTVIAIIVFVFMLLPKVWAKRANLFLCALGLGYAIKTYVLFVACYNAYCPEKKGGIYMMLVTMCLMLMAAIFPDHSIKEKKVI